MYLLKITLMDTLRRECRSRAEVARAVSGLLHNGNLDGSGAVEGTEE